ncbi:helix-turn-helix transcriptional regulator [Clostridium guangxiense]|uniref:helix-turn-helix transcriptional regulator n=1 Tax=Clostridium guangxiense TaxID=1662055 RepID=UPI001E2C40A5|nr:helix-turn-helix transcriptional regulator [Clostridium guangxiense]MCD2345080.1 helix-turn-helix transcriptional regulator [Clostridium guangxiense]
MKKNIVLSDGDKLKEIRRKYGLKQEEITGSEITRNLISEIETNKASITKKTAEVVIKNLTALAKKRRFEVDETVDYLMENQIVQANKALDNYIEELNTLSISKGDSFIKTLKEAESFLIDWDIKDKKLKIYKIAGDYYCNNNEMYKGAVYYEKALALINRVFLDRELIPLSRKLSMVYVYIGDYKKSIECCEFILNRFDDISVNDKVIFTYNNALSYFYMNNFEKTLQNLEISEKLVDRNDNLKLFKILDSKAVCLCSMKRYSEALQVFDELISLVKSNYVDRYVTVLLNIVNVYLDMQEKDKALENFNCVIERLNSVNNDSPYLSEIYFHVGKFYRSFGNEEKSEQFYSKALNLCEKQKNYVLENDILCDLIEMYTVENKVKEMNSIKYTLFSLFNKQGNINHMLVHKLVLFYIDNNVETAKELINFVLKTN